MATRETKKKVAPYTYTDEENVPPRLRCTICDKPLEEPRSLPCQHCVCHACALALGARGGAVCPSCQAAFAPTELTAPSDALMELLGELEIKCNGCAWKGTRSIFAAHLAGCSSQSISSAEVQKQEQDLNSAVEALNPQMKDMIRLRAGGRVFEASRSTLLSSPSLLHSLLAGSRVINRDDSGAVVLAVDATSLEYIITWLHTSVLPVDLSHYQRAVLIETARKLRIEALVNLLAGGARVEGGQASTSERAWTQAEFLYHYSRARLPLHLPFTNLSGVKFCRMDLKDANLYGAKLRDCDFSGTNLNNVNLTCADLKGARFADACQLSGARLVGVDLSGIDFTQAQLIRTNFSNANLAGARLADSNLTDAILTNANLTKAVLFNANMTGARCMGAKLCEADLSRAIAHNAQFNNADLRGADLSLAVISCANFSSANLSDAKALDVEFDDVTNFSSATLCHARLSGKGVGRSQLGPAFEHANLADATLHSDAMLWGRVRTARVLPPMRCKCGGTEWAPTRVCSSCNTSPTCGSCGKCVSHWSK